MPQTRSKKLPTLDLGKFRQLYKEFNEGARGFKDVEAFVKQEAAPILRNGIVQVSTHEIPTEVKEAAYRDMRTFFALSDEEKNEYVDAEFISRMPIEDFLSESWEKRDEIKKEHTQETGVRPFERGYAPYGTYTKIDWKDMYQIGPERPVKLYDVETGKHRIEEMSDNIWPTDRIATFKQNVTELQERMEAVVQDGLRIVAIDLDLDPEFFASQNQYSLDLLRILNYRPYKDAPEQTTLAKPHVDRNAGTCMFPESGLQERDIETGKWVDLETDDGNVVLFTGIVPDAISNGLYPAKLHRVPGPKPGDVGYDEPRMTVPFFKGMDQDFQIEPVAAAVKEAGKVRYPLSMNYGQMARDLGSQWTKAQEYASGEMGLDKVTADHQVIQKAIDAVYDPALRS